MGGPSLINMKFHYTYVLICTTQKGQEQFYIGYTDNISKRLYQHLHKSVPSTKRFTRVKLVYYEACKDKAGAQKRERALKTGFGRAYLKKRLKSGLNKRW